MKDLKELNNDYKNGMLEKLNSDRSITQMVNL